MKMSAKNLVTKDFQHYIFVKDPYTKRGLHKKGLPQKKYKVPISYKFDANDVVEIVLPKEYEYLKNDKTPVNKELLDKTTENKRYEKKDLAEFSDEDLVRLIIHFYGNKQITFIQKRNASFFLLFLYITIV